MRQRNVKNLEARIEANSSYRIEDPKDHKGKWNEIFGNDNPIYLEIGCGKGQFIMKQAMANPEMNFIACEGQATVILRTLEKAEEGKLNNLRVFIDFVHDLNDYFEPGEVKGIFLNFSDPWKKAKQAKRRLTHRRNLENFKSVIGDEGTIAFKTDNEDLFSFSLEEIEEMGYEVLEFTRDLHNSEYPAKEITTEYEDKFSALGKNINYVKFK